MAARGLRDRVADLEGRAWQDEQVGPGADLEVALIGAPG
jgi:hypothetical protein